VSKVLSVLRSSDIHHRPKRIMIIGGGLIGSLAAKILEDHHHHVKLIEKDPKRCEQLALQLKKTLILRGNGCDTYLLRNEDVENLDCFCALTNSDADNIVSSLHSKQLGAKQVIALVNRDAYLSLIFSGYINIDIALSPQQITISAILRHLHRTNVIQAYSLRRGTAEALEIKVLPGSPILKQTLPLQLPKNVVLTAIMRQNHIIFPDVNTTLQVDDRAILFVGDKKQMRAVEVLFNTYNGH
jgi:trk system potassium uptake protein TrkA